MTKYILPFFKSLLTLVFWLGLYILASFLLSLIHPLAPPLVIVLAMAGVFAYFNVKDRESEASIAAMRAKTDESLERLRGRLFPVESDHTQCDDSDDEAPLTRYREDDPVQRA